ncbi:MAG: NADH-quinone oxidoreductase subunit J [Alphaproteobacteria bacterium]
MIIQALAFYVFAAVAVASGVMVISARNPVHSVLFLILAFFTAAGLFVLMGAEFLAMILVVVYVGAVAVLFLFVVMMLDINFAELRQGFLSYLPVGAVIGLLLLVELALLFGSWTFAPELSKVMAAPVAATGALTNTQALGDVIYTRYVYLFQTAGLILLVAMIGAIVLTLRTRKGVRKQSVGKQFARGRTVELKKVPTGGGV